MVDKEIETKVEVKLYGVRAVIGSFDKHNPTTIYFDITVNIKGDTVTKEGLESAKNELSKALYEWLRNQDDYDKAKYIKKVEYPDTFRERYVKVTRTKLNIDLSLLQKHTLNWKETVEVAKTHLMEIYQKIVDVVLLNGMELMPFAGYNNKKTT